MKVSTANSRSANPEDHLTWTGCRVCDIPQFEVSGTRLCLDQSLHRCHLPLRQTVARSPAMVDDRRGGHVQAFRTLFTAAIRVEGLKGFERYMVAPLFIPSSTS